jgi:spermidine/putrescine-binding protein
MLISGLILVFALSACGNSVETLRVLNWGEYMDESLVDQFEEEYDVKVVYDIVDSNEAMELRIKSGTTKYDIAFPSDYMIDKLRQQDLLNEIDYDLLPGLDNVSFKSEVSSLTADEAYNDFFVPYFWGTLGIMYNTDEVDEEDLTGFDVLFDPNTEYKIGMYDSARDAAAAAFLAQGYNVNTNITTELTATEDYMAAGVYDYFGTDNLKTLVQSGNLDMALVYSGDYFDQLYVAEEAELEINFAYFVPETTNIWVDGFVIPTTSENIDLAHKFINFFLDLDVTSQNADWVGYAPVLTESYNLLVSDEYGYGEYDNYDPFPAGTTRQVYKFISDTRFTRLNELLDIAKID